jgi:hypothetical protein
MKKLKILLILSGIIFTQNSFAQTTQDVIEVKKSIIKALYQDVDSDYLIKEKSGEPFWFNKDFYKNTKKISNIRYILAETSHIKPHGGHSIVIDGDKVKKTTGIYIDDIPGYGIVVYDRNINTYKKYNKITDGDSKVFNNQPVISDNTQEIIVFDCLTQESKTCQINNKFIENKQEKTILGFNNKLKQPLNHKTTKSTQMYSFDILKYYEQVHIERLVNPLLSKRNLAKNIQKLSFRY